MSKRALGTQLLPHRSSTFDHIALLLVQRTKSSYTCATLRNLGSACYARPVLVDVASSSVVKSLQLPKLPYKAAQREDCTCRQSLNNHGNVVSSTRSLAVV